MGGEESVGVARGSKKRKGKEIREEDSMNECYCMQEGAVWVRD